MTKKRDEIEIEIDLSKIKNIGKRLEKFAKKQRKFLIPLLLILIFVFSLELRLFSAKYKKRVVKPKKGKGSYKRKKIKLA